MINCVKKCYFNISAFVGFIVWIVYINAWTWITLKDRYIDINLEGEDFVWEDLRSRGGRSDWLVAKSVWSIGGMILTKEDWSSVRKTYRITISSTTNSNRTVLGSNPVRGRSLTTYISDGQTTARGPDTAPRNVLSGPRDIWHLTNKKEYIPVRTKLWETFRNAVTVSFITFSFIIFQSLIGLSITKNTRIL